MEENKAFKLELHPEAARKLNEQAEALLLQMTTRPTKVTPPPVFTPDTPVKAVISAEEIIGTMEMSTVTPDGRRTARFFGHQNTQAGFEDEQYKNFARFCEQMQSSSAFRRHMSLEVLENMVFAWARERYCGDTDASMTEYIIPRCEAIIQEYEVWIPISHLYIQTNLGLGAVILKTFSTALFEELRNFYQALDIPQENKDKIALVLGDMQNRLQGLAAATMLVMAEPTRAYEVALENTEKAVAILRIYSKAAFVPEVSSCCAPYGQKTPKSILYYLFNQGKLAASHEGVSELDDTHWKVSENLIKQWGETGMGCFARLFFEPKKKSSFEDDVANSVMIYSRSMLATNPSDKLMFVFSALESLLLRDTSESIQQNVGERIAFVVGQDANRRREIIKNYKDAYKIRSNYVHHGRTVDETETLAKFFANIFQFYLSLVCTHVVKYKTRDEFLRALEDLKLS